MFVVVECNYLNNAQFIYLLFHVLCHYSGHLLPKVSLISRHLNIIGHTQLVPCNIKKVCIIFIVMATCHTHSLQIKCHVNTLLRPSHIIIAGAAVTLVDRPVKSVVRTSRGIGASESRFVEHSTSKGLMHVWETLPSKNTLYLHVHITCTCYIYMYMFIYMYMLHITCTCYIYAWVCHL